MTGARLKHLAQLSVEHEDTAPRPVLTLDLIESGTGRMVTDGLPSPTDPGTRVADVEPGDVLFGKLRPYLAKVFTAPRPAYASTELLCLRPCYGIESRWLHYVMLSRPVVEWAVACSEGTKMPRTSWERLADFRISAPPGEQQCRTANFLDTETARIDALVSKKRSLIRLLVERRSGEIEADIRAMAARWGDAPLKFAVENITVGMVVTPAAWYADTGVPAIRGLNVTPGCIDLARIFQ